jgi:hypothetical protein
MRFKYEEENRLILNIGENPNSNNYIMRLFDNETDEILEFVLKPADDISLNKKRYNEWLVEWPLRKTTYDFLVFESKEDGDWILAFGYWNDEGEWIDQAIWYDSFLDVFEIATLLESGLIEVYSDPNITPGTQSLLKPYVPNAIIDGVDDFQEYKSS